MSTQLNTDPNNHLCIFDNFDNIFFCTYNNNNNNNKNLKLDFKYSMIVWDERVGDPKLKDEKEGESINMKRPCPCG